MTLSILLCESQQTPPLLLGCWSMILEKRAPPKSFHFSRGRCTLRLLVQRLYGQKYPQFFRLLDQGPYLHPSFSIAWCTKLYTFGKSQKVFQLPYQTTRDLLTRRCSGSRRLNNWLQKVYTYFLEHFFNLQ